MRRVTYLLLLVPALAAADPAPAFRDRDVLAPPGPPRPLSGSTSPHLLYLAVDGATISKASPSSASKNTSPLCGGAFPAFDHTPYGSDRSQVLSDLVRAVAALFEGYRLEVVTTRPASAPYTMVVVGGQASLCGLAQGYGGLAPLDCLDAWPEDIAFVFAHEISGIDFLPVVIGHEVGHTLGLPHSSVACDVMSNQICASGSKTFLDVEAPVAPDHKGQCGLTTTNSHRLLRQVLGARGPRRVELARARPDDRHAVGPARPPLALDAAVPPGDNGVPTETSAGCAVGIPEVSPSPLWVLTIALFCRGARRRRRRRGRRTELGHGPPR